MGDIVERSNELARLEDIIIQGRATFMQVGEALAAIRDGKLYKDAGHKTFDAYCIGVWGFTANYARRQINAAADAKSVPTGTLLPKTEREARAQRKKPEPPPVLDVESKPAAPKPEQLTIPWAVPHSRVAASIAHDDIASKEGVGKALAYLRDEIDRLRGTNAPLETLGACEHPKPAHRHVNGGVVQCQACGLVKGRNGKWRAA